MLEMLRMQMASQQPLRSAWILQLRRRRQPKQFQVELGATCPSDIFRLWLSCRPWCTGWLCASMMRTVSQMETHVWDWRLLDGTPHQSDSWVCLSWVQGCGSNFIGAQIPFETMLLSWSPGVPQSTTLRQIMKDSCSHFSFASMLYCWVQTSLVWNSNACKLHPECHSTCWGRSGTKNWRSFHVKNLPSEKASASSVRRHIRLVCLAYLPQDAKEPLSSAITQIAECTLKYSAPFCSISTVRQCPLCPLGLLPRVASQLYFLPCLPC